MTPVPLPRTLASSLELLEARIAPAMVTLQIVNPTTATYTDLDGDRVTVKVSVGTLTTALFTGVGGALGEQLQLLDLHAGGFDGANLTFSVAKVPDGDGLANVGYIDSTGHNLGKVTVKGDLGQIDAGSGSAAVPAIQALTVHSMGRFGRDTQAGGTQQSDITGALGALVVAGDVKGVHLRVVGANGTIGAITIDGSLIGEQGSNSGEIESTGGIGPVKIGGDIEGGTGAGSGIVFAGGTLGNVTVAGSLLGGSGDYTGQIAANGDLGLVKIGHDVRAGTGGDTGKIKTLGKLAGVTIAGSLIGVGPEDTDTVSNPFGQIHSGGDMGAVKIGHDVQGGTGSGSGLILSMGKLASVSIGGSLVGGSNFRTGDILSIHDMGGVKIAHDVQGGSGLLSGIIETSGKLASVSIGGSLIGSSGDSSGVIVSNHDMGAVKIAHDLTGGSITGSASLVQSGMIESGARISSVSIGGSIISGIDASTGSLSSSASIRAQKDLGSLTVKGSLIGNTGDGTAANFSPVVISAHGQAQQGTTTDLAMGKITVGGRVEYANILAGYDFNLAPDNPDAQIGAVKVGGGWIASNLVAGVQNGASGNTNFGNSGDASIGAGSAGIIAKIASITIGGQVFGTPDSFNPTDHFGFSAQKIGKLKIGGHAVALPANATPLNVGATTDMSIHLLS